MFDIRITVGTIDYEKTIATVFPTVLNKCRKLQNQNLLLNLFLELGEDAMLILLGIMKRLSEDAKQELLCQCMNAYQTVLTDKLNEYLQEDIWGKNFVIRSLYIEKTGEGLELIGEGVSVDFKSLLDNEKVQSKIDEAAAAYRGFGGLGKIFGHHVGGVLKKVVEAVPEETERLSVKLMQREDIKCKLMGLAQSALYRKELILELKMLSFVSCCDADVIQKDGIASNTFTISPDLEKELIKALAGYLKMTSQRREIIFKDI